MNIIEIITHSYAISENDTKLDFISDHIFNFITYDSSIGEGMAINALEVAVAINNGHTFEYIKSKEKYKNYITMINFPFFLSKIEWGTSVRSAWWTYGPVKLESCGIYVSGEQETDLIFTQNEWIAFINELNHFSKLK